MGIFLFLLGVVVVISCAGGVFALAAAQRRQGNRWLHAALLAGVKIGAVAAAWWLFQERPHADVDAPLPPHAEFAALPEKTHDMFTMRETAAKVFPR